MRHLLSYGEPGLVYDNKAYTITCICSGESLVFYTSYLKWPVHTEVRARAGTGEMIGAEYVMTKVGGYYLTGDRDTYQQGITAYRNCRDWLKQQRDEFI